MRVWVFIFGRRGGGFTDYSDVGVLEEYGVVGLLVVRDLRLRGKGGLVIA